MTAVKIPTLRPEATPVCWLLPAERASLADTYLAAEDLIHKNIDTTAEVLRAAFKHYLAYMVYTGLMGEEFAGVANATAVHLDVAGLRAAIARTNCQLLRMLALLPMCPLRCCCTCSLPPKGSGCNRWMTDLGEQDPEGLVNSMPPGEARG